MTMKNSCIGSRFEDAFPTFNAFSTFHCLILSISTVTASKLSLERGIIAPNCIRVLHRGFYFLIVFQLLFRLLILVCCWMNLFLICTFSRDNSASQNAFIRLKLLLYFVITFVITLINN